MEAGVCNGVEKEKGMGGMKLGCVIGLSGKKGLR